MFGSDKRTSLIYVYPKVPCGLYYYITIVNDDSSIGNKWWMSRSDDTRVIIYDCNMFIVQATGL